MLKFLFTSTLVATASAFDGITTYDYPGDGTGNALTAAAGDNTHDLTVSDPIQNGATLNNQIRIDSSAGTATYIGLFPSTTLTYVDPTSHTELAAGGPMVKNDAAACVSGGTDCLLNLYRSGNVMDPVPAGYYFAISVNGNDLTYSTAVGDDKIRITVEPYISAWGSTLMQTATANNVERGADLLVTWDGYAAGDTIIYTHNSVANNDADYCPVDFHTITAAEATLGRGTIALKTSGATSANTLGFAIAGLQDVVVVRSATATSLDYVTMTPTTALTANCVLDLTGATTVYGPSSSPVNHALRQFTVVESDTITINGATPGSVTTNHQTGQKITLDYVLGSASTAGMYVGLFLVGGVPTSHVVDVNQVAATVGSTNHPLTVAYLPVGVSGAGTIELATDPLMPAGDYIVYLMNSNDAYFEPIAETSYGAHGGVLGPYNAITGAFTTEGTDITIIGAPTGEPSGAPSGEPSGEPSGVPTSPSGQPTGIPTSSPSFVEEPWGEYVWTEKRHRKAGMCENQCSGHGTCEVNGNCKCFTGLDGEDEWTGPDCSSRTCPFDFAWVGSAINSNNLHPWAECSNKGTCDRQSGECQCFTGYEGAACQRTVCPDNCNDQGTCWPEKHLASKAGRVYDAPWDAMKHVGCLCDAGYRGPACDQQECPSGADPLSGYGNEAGRDCSGRGICDYSNGICACFTGFFGTRCQHQTTVM